LLAKAFPNSDFVGYDYHVPSVETATERAKAAGATNVRFEVADATGYKANNYDLIAFFDCLHDLADPAGAARHARNALNPTELACWLSRSLATKSKTIAIPLDGSITAHRCAFACRFR
jgi:SAM-dependent methyltransferase